MFEFVFLHTQLEKLSYNTKQPETKNPFGSVSGILKFWEKSMLTEEPWASLGLFFAVAFGIFAQTAHNWKMENY